MSQILPYETRSTVPFVLMTDSGVPFDHEGEVLEVFATKRQDREAALRFLKRWSGRHPSDGVIGARKKRTCGAFDQRRRRPWSKLLSSVSIYRKGVSNSMGQRRKASRCSAKSFREKSFPILLRSAAVPGCDGRLRRRAPLGPTDHHPWPQVQADPADLCQAISEAAEE